MTIKNKITFAALLFAACGLFSCGGCASLPKLPAINADEISYHRTDPAGGTEITARNIVVTDDSVHADEATWNTTYPAFSITLHAKGYTRKLTPAEKASPVVPSPPPTSSP